MVVPEILARVHAVDCPSVERFAPSTERFLEVHGERLESHGRAYARGVVAQHYESVASMAYQQRHFALGHRYLLKSFASQPWRNPLPLAALPMGLVDALLGTTLIQQGAALQRRLFGRTGDALP